MSAEITALLHGSGYLSIAVICGLIMLEELGIPMPFAPGDLLLVLAGVAIATMHVNPLVVATATYFSAILGAVAGREIFDWLGKIALHRIAGHLHAGKRVDALTARLRQGGATAVFLGRMTPGLRVVTTEVSGLAAIPRNTFVKGLLPGVAVYEGVFLGLGAWLGPTAWTTVERYAPKPGQLLAVLLIAGASAVIGRSLIRATRTVGTRHDAAAEVQA